MPTREMSAVGQLVCLLVLLCGSALSQSDGGVPSSPCPNVFQYVNERGGVYGRISIVPPLSFSRVKLQVQLITSYYPLVAGVGQVTVRGGDRELQEITNKASRNELQTIQFMVVFPPGQPIPRIAQIVINGRDFCPNHIEYTRPRGEINLSYEIVTSLPVAVAGGDQFHAPGTNPVYTETARPADRPVQNVRPANRPVQTPYEPQPIPTQFPSVVYQTYPTQIPYVEPESSTTKRPYVPPRTTKRPYVPPRTTQRPYEPPRTTQRPYEPPYRPQPTTKPKTPQKRPSSANNGQSGEICGRQVEGPSANQLIIEGDVAEKEQWPWHAALYILATGGQTFLCGGVLVSERHILTAAHCVTDKKTRRVDKRKKYIVYLGKFNLQTLKEKGQQSMEIAEIAVHPNYNSEYLDYDIAMLTMEEPVDITRTVYPVCIWDLPEDRHPIIGKRGEVVGWGKDSSGELSPKLMRVSMPVVSKEQCQEENDEFYIKYVTDYNYCAGDRNGTSVCNGDSGGGMYFLENKKWYVRGIVNLSKNKQEGLIASCSDDDYVLFADLAKLYPWIAEKVQRVRAPTAGGSDCGTSIFPLPLIVGGAPTKHGQWPWHVAVYHVDEATLAEQYACGGTLLGPRLVITVAHCVSRQKAMHVLAGRYNLGQSVEDGEQKRAVSTKTVHPDYVPERLQNDLALLTLDAPVKYSEFVRPACLWDSSQTHITNVVGREGTVVGWGYDENYQPSDLLLSTAMPVVSLSVCIQSNPQHFSKFTSNTTYCAGYRNGISVCNGDSGGGMFFPSSDGKLFLRGLVSTSVAKIRLEGDAKRNVCDVDQYSLFTDVAKYLDWIRQYLD